MSAACDPNSLVSVITPAFNADCFLEQAIRSVHAQTWRPLEHVVVDDGSKDRTAETVSRLADNLNDDVYELKLLRQPENLGAARALADGCAVARGAWLCWLSADDLYTDSEKVSRQVKVMSDTGVSVSYYRSFTQGSSPQEAETVTAAFLPDDEEANRSVEDSGMLRLLALMFVNPINGSSAMLRARSLMTFDVGLGNVDADGDLWMRYSALDCGFAAIDGAPLFYRVHPGQTSQQSDAMLYGTAVTRLRMFRTLRGLGIAGQLVREGSRIFELIERRGLFYGMPVVAAEISRWVLLTADLGIGLSTRMAALRMYSRSLEITRALGLDRERLERAVESAAQTEAWREFLDGFRACPDAAYDGASSP